MVCNTNNAELHYILTPIGFLYWYSITMPWLIFLATERDDINSTYVTQGNLDEIYKIQKHFPNLKHKPLGLLMPEQSPLYDIKWG